jgi:hypothetical protein
LRRGYEEKKKRGSLRIYGGRSKVGADGDLSSGGGGGGRGGRVESRVGEEVLVVVVVGRGGGGVLVGGVVVVLLVLLLLLLLLVVVVGRGGGGGGVRERGAGGRGDLAELARGDRVGEGRRGAGREVGPQLGRRRQECAAQWLWREEYSQPARRGRERHRGREVVKSVMSDIE